MNEEQHKLCIRAMTEYGDINQMDMMVEECAELIQAINKYKREKTTERVKNIQEEIADVEIMLYQMKQYFGPTTIEQEKEIKLIRLKNRLEK